MMNDHGLNTSPMEQELESLIEKRRKLQEELEQIDRELKRQSKSASPRKERPRPVRAVVLDTLEEIRTLTYSREIALYVKARYGYEIPSNRFGTLGSDELKAFDSDSNRPVCLCHGLTFERFEVIKRLWARSDWPLWTRIVAPTTGRVQHLQLTIKLCEIAIAEPNAANPESLQIVAADHARALPGIKFQRGKFDLEQWRDVARAELEKWAPQDEELRREAADRLTKLDLRAQLFGVPEKMINPLPSPEQNQKQGS